MILQCPECSARFAVPDTLMPPEGRTVKCGRCAHLWHAEGVAPSEESFAELAQQVAMEEAPVIPSRLPVRQKPPLRPWPFMAGAGALAALWLLFAFIAYYPSWIKLPILEDLYETFGITSTEGLVFEDVTMQRSTNEAGKTKFLLAGSITNRWAGMRLVPTVRVQLKDRDGETIWAREYDVNEKIGPGEPYAFRIDNVETSFADRVSSVVLDVGHPLQLMMR